MVQSVSLIPATASNQYYKNVVTRHERKLDEDVFDNAEKLVKKDKVRNSDYGLIAAQTCMARDFVNADVDESRLLAAKMEFIHQLMAENLEADASRDIERTRIKTEQIPARIELSRVRGDNLSSAIKSSSDGLSTVIKSGGDFIKTGAEAVKAIAPKTSDADNIQQVGKLIKCVA